MVSPLIELSVVVVFILPPHKVSLVKGNTLAKKSNLVPCFSLDETNSSTYAVILTSYIGTFSL